jgi:DNA repair photolyase
MLMREVQVKSILTRTCGFLKSVASHSLQPYRGCTYGHSLCGVGCYAQFGYGLPGGVPWGSFLEARVNAAQVYRKQYHAERAWARRDGRCFSIFMSSSTDPFVPQEDRYRITEQLLEAMVEHPPDRLIMQTHTHRVLKCMHLYERLRAVCDLRFHISIESDRDRLPGLPAPASSVARRFEAAATLCQAGFHVVITVSPLLPIARPEAFFERIANTADAVVIDHFILGDGTPTGWKTKRTALPAAMAAVDPASTSLGYRDRMVALARAIMPGRVGVSATGFAGHFE